MNNVVPFTTLLHLYVLPLITFLGEFSLAYEMYYTRILFFEGYVQHTYICILF